METQALPRIPAAVRVSPFDGGPERDGQLLVEADGQSFLVSPAMAKLITALRDSGEREHVRAEMQGVLGHAPSDAELSYAVNRLPPALFATGAASAPESDWLFLARWPLIREREITRLAGALQGLFNVRMATGVGVGAAVVFGYVLGSDRFAALPAPRGTAEALWVILAMVVSALAHELGHAAACMRLGVRPGHVGCGVYAVFPVLYIDVSRAWRLRARERAVVDVGGMYFQGVIVLLLAPLLLHEATRTVAAIAITYNFWWVVYNLNPVFKMDGYWLVADLSGIPNLQRRTAAFLADVFALRRKKLAMLDRWVGAVFLGYAAFTVIYIGGLLWSAPAFVSRHVLPGLTASAGAWEAVVAAWPDSAVGERLTLLVGAGAQTAAVALPVLLGALLLGRILASLGRMFAGK